MVMHTSKGKDHAFEASYIRTEALSQKHTEKENVVGSRLNRVVTMLSRPYLVCFKVQKNQQ